MGPWTMDYTDPRAFGWDIYGSPLFSPADLEALEGMTFPVRCSFCRRPYDLGKVEVTGRYADCSTWKTPCCKVAADDRGETGWKTHRDYVPLRRTEGGFWAEVPRGR